MPDVTVSSAAIAASVQAYPQGRIAYISLAFTSAAADDTVDAQDIMDAAYGGTNVVMGTLLDVWDKGSGPLILNGATTYVAPYVDDATGNIKFRNTVTGALDATLDVATVRLAVSVLLGD
tara:strand:+ start:1661 stop:2020 length:360 start_codon:yes stop_codon:yes gene_type:complete